MWRLASAAMLTAVLTVAAASSLTSRADTPTSTPDASASASSAPSPSPEPAPEPLPPAPEPTPFSPKPPGPPQASIDPAYTGSLRAGDWVQITGTGSCLNMRYEPRIPAPQPDGTVHDNVLNCLPDGFVGRLDGFGYWASGSVPVQADGRWWWHIVGQGWAAEEFLRLHHQGGIPWPERPDLADAGLIAFIGRDNGVWLMNADGSGSRQIVANPGPHSYIYALRWSPAGDRLAYTISSWENNVNFFATRLVDRNGAVVAEFPGITEALWSPSGDRLSAIRTKSEALGQYYGTPIVLSVGTGTEIPVGPAVYPGSIAPAWSPDGQSLAYVCVSVYIAQPDGSAHPDPEHSCNGDGLRVTAADGSGSRILVPMDQTGAYLINPSWSPSGTIIAVYSMREGAACLGHMLIDTETGATAGCLANPRLSSFGAGGSCGAGGPAMGFSQWTADGRRFVFTAVGSGQSGVFVHDLTTDSRSLVPSMDSGYASLDSENLNLTFAAGGHIWVAGLDGSNLTLLADGHSPAWQPSP